MPFQHAAFLDSLNQVEALMETVETDDFVWIETYIRIVRGKPQWVRGHWRRPWGYNLHRPSTVVRFPSVA